MKQKLLHTNVVPPGGWRAKCPHCAYWIIAPTYPDWIEWIAKHNKSNGHPEWDYETQLCEALPPGQCSAMNGGPGVSLQCEMDSRSLLAGAVAVGSLLVEYALGREVFVDQAEADRRARICALCPKNVPVSGCTGCGTMQDAKARLSAITGERKTSADPYLRGCCICGCNCATIVWIRKDILERGFTDSQRALTEQVAPHCWKAEPA